MSSEVDPVALSLAYLLDSQKYHLQGDHLTARKKLDTAEAIFQKGVLGVGEGPLPVRAPQLWQKARRVVWARYYGGDDGWERLKDAIGELEDMVGRPASESDM